MKGPGASPTRFIPPLRGLGLLAAYGWRLAVPGRADGCCEAGAAPGAL
jgi:hypothetical protein